MPQHVYNIRRKIEKVLMNSLGRETTIVRDPDHPLLVRPPDIIVSGKMGIISIMIPTAAEAANPPAFISRYTMCRAALPSHCYFLVAYPEERDGISDAADQHVDRMLFSSDTTDIVRYCKTPTRAKRKHRFTDNVRSEIFDRFGSMMKNFVGIKKFLKKDRGTSDYSLFNRSFSASRIGRAINYNDAVINPIFAESISTETVTSLYISGSKNYYDLDDSVPYPSSREFATLLCDNIPMASADPSKYIRAAAFAGWLIAPTNAQEWIENIRNISR